MGKSIRIINLRLLPIKSRIKLIFDQFNFRVVEYRTPEEARRAIQTLNDTHLLGRPVFIREVSEIKNFLLNLLVCDF